MQYPRRVSLLVFSSKVKYLLLGWAILPSRTLVCLCLVHIYEWCRNSLALRREKRQNSVKYRVMQRFILIFLQYACGLNYFTHFEPSITQNNTVDLINHFGGSHLQWTCRKMFVFCELTVTFDLIYQIAKIRMLSLLNKVFNLGSSSQTNVCCFNG